MASMKAKKGNPFEYDTAYNLLQLGFKVSRPDMNVRSLDIIAESSLRDKTLMFFIECKNRQKLSWSQLCKIYHNTYITSTKDYIFPHEIVIPMVIFHSNYQPVLIMSKYFDINHLNNYKDEGGLMIRPFENVMKIPFNKRPKGWELWKAPNYYP